LTSGKEADYLEIFPSKWKTSYRLNNRNKGENNMEIIGLNKYVVNDRHLFNLVELNVDKLNGTVSFIKVAVDDPNYRIQNKLNIVEWGKKYVGIENNSKLGNLIPITYSRM